MLVDNNYVVEEDQDPDQEDPDPEDDYADE
jgi:hypothetical protein